MYSRVAPPDESLDATNESKFNSKTGSSDDVEGLKEDGHVPHEKPIRVSAGKWQKFQRLKERRRELCKPLPGRKKGKVIKPRNSKEPGFTSETETKSRSQIFNENRSAWKEVCQNIDVNDHLAQHSIAKEKPKSKLEEEIDKAVKQGDFTQAEAISDEIAQQELGVRIVGAIEVRDYKKCKELEEKSQQAKKKKKKLVWGFEQKERWESKGNM